MPSAGGSNEEVEALCADHKRKGATILQEPATKDFGLTFLAADPDGYRLRVFCPAP
jgi:predicted enzyme related to lactoylglutathione lyase